MKLTKRQEVWIWDNRKGYTKTKISLIGFKYFIVEDLPRKKFSMQTLKQERGGKFSPIIKLGNETT